MNSRLAMETEDDLLLRKADILSVMKVLKDLKDGKGEIDDIDHLGNRRVRSVGELMEINIALVYCVWNAPSVKEWGLLKLKLDASRFDQRKASGCCGT